MTSAVDTRASSKPYGNVSYGDPGLQADGVARYPLDSEAHCRAAWSYINMPKNAAKYTSAQVARIKSRIMAAGKKYGIEFSDGQRSAPDTFVRGFDFEMRSAGGDGRTLEGYVAMFNQRARIPDRGGDFDEELYPGFADRSLANGFPVMQFDHGKDPRVGTVPIGVYDTFDKDAKGYFVRGRLFDNPVVEPVRQAIAGKAIKGMSFRFSVKQGGGDRWTRNRGTVDRRDILDADVHEAGPVVFPAYAQTSVTVRSLFASASEEERAALFEELRQAFELTDLTGRSDTLSADGGDHDEEPWEGDTSPVTPPEIRERLLAVALRPEI
jgi:Phage head maturation protease